MLAEPINTPSGYLRNELYSWNDTHFVDYTHQANLHLPMTPETERHRLPSRQRSPKESRDERDQRHAYPPRKASLAHFYSAGSDALSPQYSIDFSGFCSSDEEEPSAPATNFLPRAIVNDSYTNVDSIYQMFHGSEQNEEGAVGAPAPVSLPLSPRLSEVVDMYDWARRFPKNMDEETRPLLGQEDTCGGEGLIHSHGAESTEVGSPKSRDIKRSRSVRQLPKLPKLQIHLRSRSSTRCERSPSPSRNSHRNAQQNGFSPDMMDAIHYMSPPPTADTDRSGYMLYREDASTTWKRRWCTIEDNHMHVCTSDEKGTSPIASIRLIPGLSVIPEDTPGTPTSSASHSPTSPRGSIFAFKVVAPQQPRSPYLFAAETRLDMVLWIASIIRAAENAGKKKVERTLIPIHSSNEKQQQQTRGRSRSWGRSPKSSGEESPNPFKGGRNVIDVPLSKPLPAAKPTSSSGSDPKLASSMKRRFTLYMLRPRKS
ncbi:uncharacterized protein EV422DRAFT_57263 [Fimicolochytrium jonesii]|uniref:uncharacterized protein n=1 Tax=Fimicolochytrium jonesii TaxID=1396493 RepID=UPI0022FE4367|nr:uncharacterized protein EV422DRAFT_57263 [Fimicolochytrium jonesii]KAI8820635.1 hypothetical protein EV422DRAFT_57263 [Fimicolochytrium jonesii]